MTPSEPMLKVASASGCEGEAMILATRVSPRPLRSCSRVVVACAMMLPPTALSCTRGWAGCRQQARLCWHLQGAGAGVRRPGSQGNIQERTDRCGAANIAEPPSRLPCTTCGRPVGRRKADAQQRACCICDSQPAGVEKIPLTPCKRSPPIDVLQAQPTPAHLVGDQHRHAKLVGQALQAA